VLGPTVLPGAAAESWRLALALLRADPAGTAVGRSGGAGAAGTRGASAAAGGSGLRRVDDNLATLLLFESRELAGRIAARRLAALADLTPKARARMRETALAHLRHDGNAVAMAAEMHVHPQTARYRIARLRELLGEQLADPDARFELQLALRAEALGAAG
jgi:DNA-binding PucR family transcriptional regulator